jgi:outer membrane protein
MIRLAFMLVVAAPLAISLRGSCSADTLSAAWNEALAYSAQLEASRLQHAAAASELAAASTERLPKVWSHASYQLRSEERSFLFANPLAPSQTFVTPYAQRDAALGTVGVSTPIYAGGAIDYGIKSAAARYDAALCAQAATRLELLLAVASAYVDVLRAQRDLEVSHQSLEALALHLQNAKSHFEQQRVPYSDVLSAQVTLATGEQTRLRTRYQLDAARAHYNLLGRPLDADVQLEELHVPPLAPGLDELQRLAVSLRPDLRELDSAAIAGQYEAERLRAATRPQICVVGRHDFEENRFQTPQGVSSAGVVIDWSIYDGGRSRQLASAQQARAASLSKLADDLRTRIALEVLIEWNNAQEAIARRQVAASALEQAEENYRLRL